MKSKLIELFDDESFGTDAINNDVGIMISDFGDMVDCLVLEYEDRYDVYLNLYDEDEAPHRNVLVKGSSKNKEIAKRIAARKLNKEYENLVH
ncbi:hypothetical protein [Sporosarcina sp. E16_8]|uniref:hypothetical protein n=1 Tax=Sporosarcina sp. E16_8 TaxID=2789295 RepID=UPI001A924273|nr:hypothetical protein [Sporosarcina sp. E16_8]MBO0586447.1 hypothetical protein [Sporosarcina sp. E16_8]